MIIFWAPEVPTFKVLLGPLRPSLVAKLFWIIVIWDPGSIRALILKDLVGVTIRQINVLGRPRFSGIYVMVARHWRPWLSPNLGLSSAIVLGEVICYSCFGFGVWSTALDLWRYLQWYLPHSTLFSLMEHFFRNPSFNAGHSLVRWPRPKHIWHSMLLLVMTL